jgi:hypothetical protein
MFVLGAVWFSKPLFLKPWMRSAGLEEGYDKKGSIPLIFGGAFLLTLIMAVLLAFFTDPFDFGGTVLASLAAGLGWASLSFWMLSLFERKPFVYALINGGYLTLGFVAMGAILGAWK